MADECEKKAAEIGFDLTKQFLTLAFAGIAFVVGLFFNTPGSVSAVMLWMIVAVFGASVVLGLLFLMRGVNLLSVHKSYDIYEPSLRAMSIFQILLILFGTVFLATLLRARQTPTALPAHTMEIRFERGGSMTYPIDPSKNITVQVEDGKAKILVDKQ